ncbi:hypothetical protein AWF58_26415 [Escherichia coli]|nr:hypothetical protein AWF58_26415 [Escherichia coli]
MFALMWFQTWPLLYAILNSAMTFYAKQNGAPVVLSELSQIQLKYSDLASTAGLVHHLTKRRGAVGAPAEAVHVFRLHVAVGVITVNHTTCRTGSRADSRGSEMAVHAGKTCAKAFYHHP